MELVSYEDSNYPIRLRNGYVLYFYFKGYGSSIFKSTDLLIKSDTRVSRIAAISGGGILYYYCLELFIIADLPFIWSTASNKYFESPTLVMSSLY